MFQSPRSRRTVVQIPQAKVVVFRLGEDTLAFPVQSVERVLRYRAPSPLPDVPEWIRGVMDHAGRPVPVVDMRRRMSMPPERPRFQARIIIVATAAGPIGAAVDAVLEVASIPEPDIQPPPGIVRGLAAEFVRGIARRNDAPLLILDADRILTSDDRLALERALTETPPSV